MTADPDIQAVRNWLALDPRADWEADPDGFGDAAEALDRLAARLANLRFCPTCAAGYEWQEGWPREGLCAGCRRAEAAEASNARLTAALLAECDRRSEIGSITTAFVRAALAAGTDA